MTESVSRGGRPAPGFALGDASPACAACPAALPSGSSAAALLGGDWRALPLAVGHTALRATLVGAGLYLAGERDPKRLVKNAAAGSLAIEAFVLGWAAWKLRHSAP
jgi:hypothetical protein